MLKVVLTSILLIAAGSVGWRRGDFAAIPDTSLAPSGFRIVVAPRPQVLRAVESKTAKTLDVAWHEAMAETDETRRLEMLSQLARRMSLADVPRMLEWISGIEAPEVRCALRRVVLGGWARSDGPGAIAYLQTLPESEQRDTLVKFLVGDWAEASPAAAVRWFASGSAADWVQQTSVALGNALAYHPFETVRDLMQVIPDGAARSAVCEMIVERWRDSHGADAARLIVSATTGQTQSDLLGQVIPQWAQNDLPGAVQWMRQLPAGSTQTAALIHLGYTWIDSDPAGAAEFAQRLPAGNEQFLTLLAGQWAQRDPQAASTWARQLPEGPTRDRALASLAAAWAQQDPRASVAFALGLPPGNAQNDAVISVVSAWAAKEPGPAAVWAASFPSGPQREYAIENVFTSWAQTDAVAAVAWLQRLSPGADRDTALHAGAGSLVDSYPDLAAQLAIGIGDPDLRNRQAVRAVRAWLAIDPKGARTWAERSNLPSSLKAHLLEPRS